MFLNRERKWLFVPLFAQELYNLSTKRSFVKVGKGIDTPFASLSSELYRSSGDNLTQN